MLRNVEMDGHEARQIIGDLLASRANMLDLQQRTGIREAAERRLWMERKLGQVIAATPLSKGGPPDQVRRQCLDGTAPTLAYLGLTRKQSWKFRAVAYLPLDDFMATLNGPTTPSTKAMLRKALPLMVKARAEREAAEQAAYEARTGRQSPR